MLKYKAAASGFFNVRNFVSIKKATLFQEELLEVLSGFQDATVSTFATFAELM